MSLVSSRICFLEALYQSRPRVLRVLISSGPSWSRAGVLSACVSSRYFSSFAVWSAVVCFLTLRVGALVVVCCSSANVDCVPLDSRINEVVVYEASEPLKEDSVWTAVLCVNLPEPKLPCEMSDSMQAVAGHRSSLNPVKNMPSSSCNSDYDALNDEGAPCEALFRCDAASVQGPARR